MRIALFNKEQIRKAFEYTLQQFDKGLLKGANFILEPFIKDKTKEQLRYFFGCIAKAINEQRGLKIENAKLMFYDAVAKFDDNFKVEFTDINGNEQISHKTISDMKVDEMSLFISHCLFLIDHSDYLNDIILHPSIRYSWIYSISKQDLMNINRNLPRIDREYLEHQRKESCIVCGVANRSEVHHLKEMGFTGTSYKADDWLSLPLCKCCHDKYHNKGKEQFDNELKWIINKMDLVDFCTIKYNRWRNKC